VLALGMLRSSKEPSKATSGEAPQEPAREPVPPAP
jgi:hypothetical protein